MMPNKCLNIVLLVLVCLLAFSTYAVSGDVQSNEENRVPSLPNIQLKSWLQKPGDTANASHTELQAQVNQPIILFVEVSTPRWFTAGTQLSLPEIANVIVQKPSQLAVNYAEKRAGSTWSVQLWEIHLYPQQEGHFVVPSLRVQAQVSVQSRDNVQSEMYTQPLKFNAQLPTGLLTPSSAWINSPQVEVTQKWQQSSAELKAGDAITRTVTVTADNTLAMLLPPIFNRKHDLASNHYQLYSQPIKLLDAQHRHQFQAQRTEQQVYVLQHGGEVTLPEHSILWWNSRTQQLENVRVEARTFKVAHTLTSWMNYYKNSIAILLLFLFGFSMLIIAMRRFYKTRPQPLFWQFSQVLYRGDTGEIRAALYAHLRRCSSELQMSKLSSASQWQIVANQIQTQPISFVQGWLVWCKIALMRRRTIGQIGLQKALPELDNINRRY
ncbi:BatD family protein [Vibrio ezurae]|nr:BatD family protein [Vibrio ezurae]